MTWKVAPSLDRLRYQLNELAPNRSTIHDGGIGDADHATRDSDHNPWVVIAGQAYVTARDFTHDVPGGLDCDRLAAALIAGRDRRLKYIIWEDQILSGAEGRQPWEWREYHGPNLHTKHLHLSVVPDLRCTLDIPWLLPGLATPAPVPSRPLAPTPYPPLRYGMRDSALVARVQAFLADRFPRYAGSLPSTGHYLDRTAAVVREFQHRSGITGPDADGRTVGNRTWAALARHGFR
ncbi:MAG: peptidoglycan-binding domain-containing protein [Phycicoccus sp.]